MDASGNPIIVRGLLEYSVEDAAGMWSESRDTVYYLVGGWLAWWVLLSLKMR